VRQELQRFQGFLSTATADHSRLLILGGAGTGKTTLMQYLALQSVESSVDGPIPVLLRLRQLTLEADPHLDLLTVIQHTLDPDGLVLPQVEDFWQTHVNWLLLDGWDEITPALQTTLTQQLQVLLDRHPHLRVIITSRPGTLTPALRGFTVLDLAEFSTHQVEQFVQRWFQANDPEMGADLATACLEALHSPANERFHALSLTPMLLHLICLVFWHQRQFPTQAGQLYQQALDLLMGRWDQQRGVVRDRPPLAASLTAFDMLRLLSQVATRTFERNQVLISKSDLVMLIAQSLTGAAEGATDPEQRWAASQHILQVWVEHYGILVEHAYEAYGFSHLSIQEYLVARRWAISAMDRHEPEDWQALSTHLSDERWRDVMAFTVEMLPDATMLVRSLHLEAQALLTDDPDLHAIAAWVEERAIACEQPDQIAALQAHYLGLLVDQDLDLAIALNPDLGFHPPPPLVLDRAIHHLLEMAQGLMHQPSLQAGFNLYFAMDLYQCYALAPEFEAGLKELQQSLVQVLETANWLSQWQHSEGTLWLERLHHLCTIHHHHPAVHRLQPSQRLVLQQFYQAQQLIVRCAKRSSATLPQSLFS